MVYGLVWSGLVWYGVIWYDMIWSGMVWGGTFEMVEGVAKVPQLQEGPELQEMLIV